MLEKALFRILSAVTICGFVLVFGACQSQESIPSEAADLMAVTEGLEAQVEAWNRGDIDAFMSLYAKEDSLRFASGNTILKGWDSTIERYRRVYPDTLRMGKLRFDLLEKRRLSDEWITVFGRYHLTRDESVGDSEGLFTLMFRRYPDGWRIVTDHTSTEAS